jgi:streptogramin lyase
VRSRQILLAVTAAVASTLAFSPGASAVRIDEAALGAATDPYDVAAGPDGGVFVTEQGADRVDKVRADGGVTGQFPLGPGADPAGIAAGPDGNLWVAEFGTRKIARVTPAGGVSHFPPGTTTGQPLGIAAGPDGNLWFTEFGASVIGRIRPDGMLQQFGSGGSARDIAAGPDGNLWFTLPGAIGRMTPAGTLLPPFSAGISPGAAPNSIALGPDGNLWFTEAGGIARITPTGTVKEFALPPAFTDPSSRIAAGPDGNLWFTQFNDDRVGRITPSGAITLYTQGITANGSPSGIATAADGRIWFAQFNGDRLGTVTLEPPTAVTGGATAIGPAAATVVATVNPLDYPTTVRFEYGPTTAYGSSTAPVALAARNTAVPVLGQLTGLTPQSTFHFRVVAASPIGTTIGSDVTFVTAPFPRVSTPIRFAFSLFARYTRVTRLKVLQAPAGARIELRCKVRRRGCFKGVKRVSVQSVRTVNLRRRFLRRSKLRPRAVLELRIIVPGSIGKVVRFKIRRTRLPRSRVLCLPPAATRPQRC